MIKLGMALLCAVAATQEDSPLPAPVTDAIPEAVAPSEPIEEPVPVADAKPAPKRATPTSGKTEMTPDLTCFG
jgi:hypothetical protein